MAAIVSLIFGGLWKVLGPLATFFSTPPGSYLLVALLAGGAWWYSGHLGYERGASETQAAQKLALQTAIGDAQRLARTEQAKRDQITHDADVALARSEEKVRTVTQQVIRYVPTVITPSQDARCTLSLGFVRLLDAAGLGVAPTDLPNRSSEPDSTDSGIPLSRATALLAQNLGDAATLRRRIRNARDAWASQEAVKGR